MRGIARVAWAFLRRDSLTENPLRWAMDWMDAGLFVVFWYFVTRGLGAGTWFGAISSGDYFLFSLIGLALTQTVWRGFAVFSDRLKSERDSGFLEPLWVSRYPLTLLIALSSIWDFLAATVNAGIVLSIGAYGLGAPLGASGILRIMGIGLVASVAMGALGLLVSSWVIAFGRGDLFRPLVNKLIPILCGAFFPISVFPGWLKAAAWCLPLTHGLVLAREVAMPSGKVATAGVWVHFLGLTGCLAFLGWASLTLAIRCARTNGRLAAM